MCVFGFKRGGLQDFEPGRDLALVTLGFFRADLQSDSLINSRCERPPVEFAGRHPHMATVQSLLRDYEIKI